MIIHCERLVCNVFPLGLYILVLSGFVLVVIPLPPANLPILCRYCSELISLVLLYLIGIVVTTGSRLAAEIGDIRVRGKWGVVVLLKNVKNAKKVLIEKGWGWG